LKLQCDETLSNFAFSFNLRRYTVLAARAKKSSKQRKNAGKSTLAQLRVAAGAYTRSHSCST
jgi:hypothetical protein